jgi:aminocarboxymuconate-semialdehyde decarboxylase
MADDNPLDTVAGVKRLSREDRALVTGGNAARLLKMKLR